jgi:hypothetical protein
MFVALFIAIVGQSVRAMQCYNDSKKNDATDKIMTENEKRTEFLKNNRHWRGIPTIIAASRLVFIGCYVHFIFYSSYYIRLILTIAQLGSIILIAGVPIGCMACYSPNPELIPHPCRRCCASFKAQTKKEEPSIVAFRPKRIFEQTRQVRSTKKHQVTDLFL